MDVKEENADESMGSAEYAAEPVKYVAATTDGNGTTYGVTTGYDATSNGTTGGKTEDSDDNLYGGVLHAVEDLTSNDYSSDANYQKLTAYGIGTLVAAEFCEMFNAGILTYDTLEERTLEFAKTYPVEQARFVLNQFRKSNLLGILTPSAYLGSLVKNFKERIRLLGAEAALSTPVVFAPSREKIQAILDRTGYPLEVTIGQRKYGGPPPGYEGPVPTGGCEVYVGKLPKDVYEDELVTLFEQCGQLYDLRLMMDPLSGTSKGYAFATYMQKQDAASAAKKYEGYEIRTGKKIRVNVSIANTRLFIGNIPKSKSKEDILEEFQNSAELDGLHDVIVYPSADDPDRKKNRGFAFLEFQDHKSASTAKRRLSSGRIRPWNCDLVVDWAEPQDDVDEEAMQQVKALYIKNVRDHITEDLLKEAFAQFGELEKVKKLKDYAFVHYNDRESALKAIEGMHNKDFHGCKLDVTLARPQSENRKKMSMNRMARQFGDRGGFSRGGGFSGGSGGNWFGGSSGGGYGGGYGDPTAAYGYGYGGGYDYSAGAYDYTGGYGGGYGMSPMGGTPRGGAMGGFGGVRGMRGGGMTSPARGRGGFGGPMGMSPGFRGPSPYGAGSPGMRPPMRGGTFGAMNRGGKGGLPIKRALPTGASTSSPKRKNDGSEGWY